MAARSAGQALQARACGVEPTVHMNPVLLKPESETGAQIIVQGRRIATLKARDYTARKPELLAAVLDSYGRLSAEADLVLVEGAGSPAEVNLRAGDIANMASPKRRMCRWLLVADIHRGGVIASLVGTHAVITPAEAARIRGFIINRFRRRRGAVRRRHAHRRGSHRLAAASASCRTGRRRRVCRPRTPTPWPRSRRRWAAPSPSPCRCCRASPISTTLDPLRAGARRVGADGAAGRGAAGRCRPGAAAGVEIDHRRPRLPAGPGLDVDIAAHVRRGGRVLGLCAGFQMMGRRLHDPDGIDGAPGSAEGLGLLDLETVMTPEKSLVAVAGTHRPDRRRDPRLRDACRPHRGPGAGAAAARPRRRPDGAVSADGRIAGCYVHGLFAADGFRAAFLAAIRPRADAGLAYDATVDATLDGLRTIWSGTSTWPRWRRLPASPADYRASAATTATRSRITRPPW